MQWCSWEKFWICYTSNPKIGSKAKFVKPFLRFWDFGLFETSKRLGAWNEDFLLSLYFIEDDLKKRLAMQCPWYLSYLFPKVVKSIYLVHKAKQKKVSKILKKWSSPGRPEFLFSNFQTFLTPSFSKDTIRQNSMGQLLILA